MDADNKTRLEDLYLPYKPKRRTKGQIAIEAGLEPLADSLWTNPNQQPELVASAYVAADKGVADEKAALDGARAILMERIAEDADLLERLRSYLNKHAVLQSRVVTGKEREGEKFKDYFGEHNLEFVGLPDPKHSVLKLYGQQVKIFKFGRMPAQLLIDKEGAVRFVHYGHDMTDIPKTSEMLELIDCIS